MSETSFNQRTADLAAIWRDNRWLYLLAGFALGLLALPAAQMVNSETFELLTGLVPEAVGITFTVLIVERLARSRAERDLKEQLIFELCSEDNSTALRSLRLLKHKGWDKDGSLKGANLEDANLERANLEDANLAGANLTGANLAVADLYGANLTGSDLTGTNLEATDLYGANLSGADLQFAELKGAHLAYVSFDEKTLLPDAKQVGHDENRNPIYDKYWTPDTDMTRYTDPNHPDFWQPEWAKRPGTDDADS